MFPVFLRGIKDGIIVTKKGYCIFLVFVWRILYRRGRHWKRCCYDY